jgi:pimeloyl-ACP methyl ester carboxylesterase
VVGHDLGAHVTYAYVRRFPESLRGAIRSNGVLRRNLPLERK